MNNPYYDTEDSRDYMDDNDESFERDYDRRHGLGRTRVSLCCHALPVPESLSCDTDPQTGLNVWTGYCSRCKDGSGFILEEA